VAQRATLDAYNRVPTGAPVYRWFFNSAIVAFAVVTCRATVATIAGYAFARVKFPGRDVLFMVVLGTMMVPATVLFVPRYIVVLNLGLVDTLNAMWVPFMVDAFGVFLIRSSSSRFRMSSRRRRASTVRAASGCFGRSSCRLPGRRWPRCASWPFKALGTTSLTP